MLKGLGYRAFLLLAPLLAIQILMFPGYSCWATDRSATLVVAIPTYIDSLDPTNHRSRLTEIVLKNIYESLTTRDAGLTVRPLLAAYWENLDPLTWRFKLQRGVSFHDHREFSSRDVKFTLDRVTRPEAMDGLDSPRRELFEPIDSIEAPDDLTVLIKTRRPWPILPMMLSLQEIMPYPDAPDKAQGFVITPPPGTGPFRLVEAKSGQEIIMERFAGYHGPKAVASPSGAVPVQRLIFRVIPKKVDQIALLKSGEVDLISGVASNTLGILSTTPGLDLISRPATRSYFAEINCQKPPFDDRWVRQALNHAVDMAGLVDHVLDGHGVVLPTVLLPNAFGYNDQLSAYDYDPQRANQLLAAGHYPPGRPLSIHCNEDDRDVAHTIALFLTKIGLQAKVQVQKQYRPTTTGASAPWDIFVGSWGNSTLDPVDIIVPKFKCKGRGNFSGYCNDRVDELLAEAERTANLDIRWKTYGHIQQLILEDAPMIFGYAPEEFYCLRDRVKNFDPPPTGMFQFRDVLVEPGG